MKDPMTLPSSGMSRQAFEIERNDFAAPEAGGRIGGVQSGFPLWRAVWTIGTIGAAKSDELRAFMAQLRGGQRRFLGRDLARPFPKAHLAGFDGMTRAGGGAFDGSATSWSESINADDDAILTLHGLPDGLVLSAGDYIDFRYAATEDAVAGVPWRAMVRVVVGGTANSSGDVAVFTEPPLPSVVPPEAVAHLDNPACVMVQLADRSSLDPVTRRLAVGGGTLMAVQDLRA